MPKALSRQISPRWKTRQSAQRLSIRQPIPIPSQDREEGTQGFGPLHHTNRLSGVFDSCYRAPAASHQLRPADDFSDLLAPIAKLTRPSGHNYPSETQTTRSSVFTDMVIQVLRRRYALCIPCAFNDSLHRPHPSDANGLTGIGELRLLRCRTGSVVNQNSPVREADIWCKLSRYGS